MISPKESNTSYGILLVELSDHSSPLIENTLKAHCPRLVIRKKVDNVVCAQSIIDRISPEIVIIDVNEPDEVAFKFLKNLAYYNTEVIIATQRKGLAYEAIKFNASGFVLKPVEPDDLVLTIRKACETIRLREEFEHNKKLVDKLNNKLSEDDIIGIPVMEGFEFLKVRDIIYCKGMQRCSQIVKTDDSKIISSYNLGEFRKILEPLGFFSPHKSYLINLKYIKKYNRIGSILMQSNTIVPVSRRKKANFLGLINHI